MFRPPCKWQRLSFFTTFKIIFLYIHCFALKQSFEDRFTESASGHFYWIQIRIQALPNSGFQIKIKDFVWQKCKKNLNKKLQLTFLSIFSNLQKNLKTAGETSNPQRALQNMKFLHFFDQMTKLNPDALRIRILKTDGRIGQNFRPDSPFIHLLATYSVSYPSFFKESVASFMTPGFRHIVS